MSEKLKASEQRVKALFDNIQDTCLENATGMSVQEMLLALNSYTNSLLVFGIKDSIEKADIEDSKQLNK